MSRGKFIVINTHMISKERSKIDTLLSKLKELEDQDQENSKASRGQERSEQNWRRLRHEKPFKKSINPRAGFLKRSTK